MLDQAQDLRRLAFCRVESETPCVRRPALVVVLGAKGGVGTTTVALNMASNLAQAGRGTVLVDADPRGGDVGLFCGVEKGYSIAHLIQGMKPGNETLPVGPNGLKLVLGCRDWRERGASAASASNQLLARLGDPNLQADLAVIDAGNVLDEPTRDLCLEADAVLLVTTIDAASVINTFEAIKSLVDILQDTIRLHLIVNKTPTAHAGKIIHYRLARACRRLLGVDPPSAGYLKKNCFHFRINPNGTIPFTAKQEKSGWFKGNHSIQPIRLNLPASPTDTMRRVLTADVLLSWRMHAEFDGPLSGQSTK
jgi:flagellar biosynthesis protein FlhG